MYQDSEESSKDGEAEADAKEGGEIRKNSSSFAKLEVLNFFTTYCFCLSNWSLDIIKLYMIASLKKLDLKVRPLKNQQIYN